jgi:translocation and assembly module TamA
LQWTANASAFFSAKVAMRPTLALRVAAGASTGTSLDNIPADERYYVGGGGSVRGYAYQTVGNLTDGEADGGKSFAETAIELRLKVSESWGIAIFADGGYAYPDELPNFGTDFLWGAGLGIRYHTSFAPIRFDVATPLNRRDGIDDSVQFYVSIGQAF